MSPAQPVINLRDREWRTSLKAALDLAFGDALSEPVPEKIARTHRKLGK